MFVLQHGEMAKVPCHRSSLILDGPSILAERQFLNARQIALLAKILKFTFIYPHLWEVSKKRLLLYHMLALVPSRALNFRASRMHVAFVSCCSSYSLSVSSCKHVVNTPSLCIIYAAVLTPQNTTVTSTGVRPTMSWFGMCPVTVSYTHLTLPTIYSV